MLPPSLSQCAVLCDSIWRSEHSETMAIAVAQLPCSGWERGWGFGRGDGMDCGQQHTVFWPGSILGMIRVQGNYSVICLTICPKRQ